MLRVAALSGTLYPARGFVTRARRMVCKRPGADYKSVRRIQSCPTQSTLALVVVARALVFLADVLLGFLQRALRVVLGAQRLAVLVHCALALVRDIGDLAHVD